MAEPAETPFTDHVGDGALFGSLSDFIVWNEVAPVDAQNLSEAFRVKGVEMILEKWTVVVGRNE